MEANDDARGELDGMSGRALFKIARGEPQLQDVHLIGLSGAAQVDAYSADGPHDWLRDPFDPHRLAERAAEVLRLAPGFLGPFAD